MPAGVGGKAAAFVLALVGGYALIDWWKKRRK
jgi:hypothetical protein